MIEVDLLDVSHIAFAKVVFRQGLEFHVEQTCRVVGALQEGANAQEVQRNVLQHRAHRHTPAEMRTKLHPLKKRARIALKGTVFEHAVHFEPGLVLRLPYLCG